MELTKSKLKQLIKEELAIALNELNPGIAQNIAGAVGKAAPSLPPADRPAINALITNVKNCVPQRHEVYVEVVEYFYCSSGPGTITNCSFRLPDQHSGRFGQLARSIINRLTRDSDKPYGEPIEYAKAAAYACEALRNALKKDFDENDAYDKDCSDIHNMVNRLCAMLGKHASDFAPLKESLKKKA